MEPSHDDACLGLFCLLFMMELRFVKMTNNDTVLMICNFCLCEEAGEGGE